MKIQVLRLITLVSIFLSGLWSVAAFGAPAQGAPIVIGVLEDRSIAVGFGVVAEPGATGGLGDGIE